MDGLNFPHVLIVRMHLIQEVLTLIRRVCLALFERLTSRVGLKSIFARAQRFARHDSRWVASLMGRGAVLLWWGCGRLRGGRGLQVQGGC